MKKVFMIFTVFIYFVISANAQMSRADLQKMYMDYLKTEGYMPTLHESGNHISFKSEGLTYYIDINDSDLGYFNLQHVFWHIESEEDLIKALVAASEAGRKTKVAKIYTFGEDSMMCEAAIFIKQPQDFKDHFARLMRAVRFEVNTFREEANKL